ncbi:cold-shock protein [Streptomyces sp. NPDC050560]|uniref:cold-shock protein n=1 Tax=Streptomyces sp. NPDC050560 TaxID=3365630 RepID=UPI00379C4F78
MAQGVVVRFDDTKGYGFIAPDEGGDDVFVHANELSDRGASITCGTRVEFGMVDSGRGLKAFGVRVLSPAPGKVPVGGPLPSGALDDSRGQDDVPTPPPAARQAPRGEGAADDTCEVFARADFTRLATELLLTKAPDLSGHQVLALRGALVEFAAEHGWVE